MLQTVVGDDTSTSGCAAAAAPGRHGRSPRSHTGSPTAGHQHRLVADDRWIAVGRHLGGPSTARHNRLTMPGPKPRAAHASAEPGRAASCRCRRRRCCRPITGTGGAAAFSNAERKRAGRRPTASKQATGGESGVRRHATAPRPCRRIRGPAAWGAPACGLPCWAAWVAKVICTSPACCAPASRR